MTSQISLKVLSQSNLLDYILGTEQSESCGVTAKNPKLRNVPSWFQLCLTLPFSDAARVFSPNRDNLISHLIVRRQLSNWQGGGAASSAF